MAAAAAPVAVIVAGVLLAVVGIISPEAMVNLALGAGENPGMLVFGAMFLASPVQWLTGRTQVRVRKFLGIVFFLLGASNGAMFAIERLLTGAAGGLAGSLGAAVGAPFLIAGSIGLALSVPLFLTSSRWSQKVLGMKRWRLLHKATYLVAVALLAHVMLIGDPGLGALLIAAGFVARIPAVRRRLEAFRDR
jgi:DMSO/TMAO reductase YedYZ heme-binding membrane subunit